MKKLKLSDTSLKQGGRKNKLQLTFREKIEMAKLLDRLGVDVIEIDGIAGGRAEVLRVKSVCSAVKHACVAVPVAADGSNAEEVLGAMTEAPAKRLQVVMPVSNVQMEYLCHIKSTDLPELAAKAVAACTKVCDDVEFVAQDATRADKTLLCQVLAGVMEAGAKTVTLCDDAGELLPEEFAKFLKELLKTVPGLKKVNLALDCSDAICMAVPCAVAGLKAGCGELKISSAGGDAVSLAKLAPVLAAKKEALNLACGLKNTELNRVLDRIGAIVNTGKSAGSPFENGVADVAEAEQILNEHDSEESVAEAVKLLGYDLSDEDSMRVFEAFRVLAQKKGNIGTKELEVIIASEAMQVPESYQLESYMVTSGNRFEATAHIKLKQNGNPLDGISLGDGPIDAAFLAIEKITGCHYELDDFQIQAITEGREALGQTLVRLRAGGKVYSGRGTSTDIIGSAVKAYINALNKIVYEEERA